MIDANELRRNEQIGIDRFARFDHSISRMRIANSVHTPSWLGAMIYCLRHGDFVSAELIEARNQEVK